jgi:class 3 adenylate cyclase
MAVFIGESRHSYAAIAALKIHGAVKFIVQPALQARYPNEKCVIKQKIGIDASKVMVAKTGIRGSKDLVWVGNSANNAAKLAALGTAYSSYISEAVFSQLGDTSKYGGTNNQLMWRDLGIDRNLGIRVYGSTWYWELQLRQL